VTGDAAQLRQVIHNLLANAEDALSGEAEPVIRIATGADVRGALLTVSDNGGGFPREILARAFEPYVTTKAKGTGLGLAIVKKIVIEHGGTIVILTSPDGGARVRLRLPAAGTAAAIAASEWRPPPPSRPHHVRPLEPDA